MTRPRYRQIAHLHGSVPFYMDQTFKAAVNLQP
jgi:hypothetical protein